MELIMRSKFTILLTCAVFLASAAAAAPGPADRCSASKVKATAKNALKTHLCHAKASKKGLPVDIDCLLKAADRMVVSFYKA
jgi:hypothetical protein